MISAELCGAASHPRAAVWVNSHQTNCYKDNQGCPDRLQHSPAACTACARCRLPAGSGAVCPCGRPAALAARPRSGRRAERRAAAAQARAASAISWARRAQARKRTALPAIRRTETGRYTRRFYGSRMLRCAKTAHAKDFPKNQSLQVYDRNVVTSTQKELEKYLDT